MNGPLLLLLLCKEPEHRSMAWQVCGVIRGVVICGVMGGVIWGVTCGVICGAMCGVPCDVVCLFILTLSIHNEPTQPVQCHYQMTVSAMSDCCLSSLHTESQPANGGRPSGSPVFSVNTQPAVCPVFHHVLYVQQTQHCTMCQVPIVLCWNGILWLWTPRIHMGSLLLTGDCGTEFTSACLGLKSGMRVKKEKKDWKTGTRPLPALRAGSGRSHSWGGRVREGGISPLSPESFLIFNIKSCHFLASRKTFDMIWAHTRVVPIFSTTFVGAHEYSRWVKWLFRSAGCYLSYCYWHSKMTCFGHETRCVV